MKSIEEFQETQKLIDEYNGFDNKVGELENKIELNKKMSDARIERLKEQLNLTWEDVEFEIDRNSLQKEIENSIKNEEKNLQKENEDLNKEIKESKDSKKFFRTDNNLRTITMEIEAMKNEIDSEELEIDKKNIELREFYSQEQHEDNFKWKKIYDEIDSLKDNISKLNDKIKQYTEFKEELNSINLTPDEYKEMFKRENERIAKETQAKETQAKSNEPTSVQSQQPEPSPAPAQPKQPEPAPAQAKQPEPTPVQPKQVEPTSIQSQQSKTTTEPAKQASTKTAQTKQTTQKSAQPQPVKSVQDYVKFVIDSDSDQAIIEEMKNGMHISTGFNLDKIFKEKKELRKEAKQFIKDNELDDYSKIIKMVNPAVLKMLLVQNDKELMKNFLDAYCGDKDKLPIEYNVKLESNSIYMNEKTFRKLNRSLIKDNKYLGTEFPTTPYYTLKKVLSKFPGLGDKYKNALPAPQGNELQNAVAKKEKFESLSDKTHNNFVEQYKINENEYNKNKAKAQKLQTKMNKISIKNNAKGIDKVKNGINSVKYNITKSKHEKAVSKAKSARDEMLKNSKGPNSMSSGYKEFVKKQEEGFDR